VITTALRTRLGKKEKAAFAGLWHKGRQRRNAFPKGGAPLMLKGNRTGTNFARSGHASILGFENQTSRQLEGSLWPWQLLTELLAVIRSLSVQLWRKKTSSKVRCGLNSIVDGEKFEQSCARVMFSFEGKV
jgi:hypothetical protein